MSPATVILVVVIALLCVYASYSYIKKLRKGGDCCGSHETAEKKVRVDDRDRHHYPYQVSLVIGGMLCTNCSRKVENALNRQAGVWASLDFAERRALVRMKQPLDDQTLRRIVRECGYHVERIEDKQGY